jgi:carbon dioxide concentrating mechanism protein CcmN
MSSLIRSSSPAVIRDAHLCISGPVTIDPSAAIAPNVLLQADPGSELIVAANVCIGMGCVLHAHQGSLELEAGVTLGSGVLIIGHGKIGANACVGSMSTIINSSVLPHQIIPPGSLVGDGSRQVVEVEPSSPTPDPPPSPDLQADSADPTQPSSAESAQANAGGDQPTPQPSATAKSSKARVVYGQTYIERMMLTMFPHRQSFNADEEQRKDEG